MLHVLSATAPIFLVVGLGYLLTRRGMFKRADMTVLSTYVVKVALPLLVFVNVAGRSAAEIFQPTYLLTYALASMVMFALSFGYARVRGRSAFRATFMAMGMGGTNNGFIGFPVFLILFAESAGAATGMGMLVDNILIIPFTLFLADQADGEGGLVQRLVSTVRNVLLHPMVLAIIAALVLQVVDLTLPPVLDRSVRLLAQTSSGVALFTVGGMLVGLKIRGELGDIVTTVAGKLLVMPALAIVLVTLLVALGLPGLAPQFRAAVVLTSALPTYAVLPALAEPYGEKDVATASMMLSTLVSFLTLSGWMVALRAMGWM
ncbi:AEC family transporter [Raineyella fluvialis]|uniref:AEC family transporter n=1 Tax=Raineyella fluvialis TaxID=2662261 RepID=A0A5Q2FC98_9ACTN|nr:AEC family transporter [Raineyella fluvialis]QGF23357.1 AEC family transporter [Raineyella fluvialis]